MEGFPSEEELVLVTITGVNPHSAFAVLDEYGRRTGLIHISEIATGRIRNIRDFVKEGQKTVCKVLRVDKEKGHIDLTLRRVTEAQKREKMNLIKQEQVAAKMLEQVAKQRGEDSAKIMGIVAEKIKGQYLGVYAALEAVSLRGASFEKMGIDKGLAKDLTDMVKSRIKPPAVMLSGDFKLSTTAPNGAEIIRDALVAAQVLSDRIVIAYVGAGTYHLKISTEDFKTGEKLLKEVVSTVTDMLERAKGTVQFIRHEES